MDRPWSLQAHLTFGGWMEHSFFLVNETVSASARHDSVSVYLDIFSIGAASGTNPSPVHGSAIWTGIMVGFDESIAGPGISRLEHEEDNLYLGNATLTIDDFAMPEVDVHFTDVANAESGRRLRDVSWFDLPVNAGGFEGRGILGRFYGPAHEEVGGGLPVRHDQRRLWCPAGVTLESPKRLKLQGKEEAEALRPRRVRW